MFGVSLLSPLFLLGALAAAVPIALHLYGRPAEPAVTFSATRLLRQAPMEQARRRRLRDWLLLIMRVAALILLALAFARPLIGASAAMVALDTMVAVDVSASMSAPGQIARARALAEQAIRDVPAGGRVGVATFAQSATVLAPLSDARAAVLAVVPRIEVGAGATSYRDALAQVASSFNRHKARLVVITDLQRSGWRDSASDWPTPGVSVEVVDVGAPPRNLAVTTLALERDAAMAVVRNFGATDVSTAVSFERDGVQAGRVEVHLPAGGSAEARTPLAVSAGSVVTASLDDPVGYAADNTRYAVSGADARMPVLVISGSKHPQESYYVERALAVAAGRDGFRLRVAGAADVSALADDEIEAVAVALLVSTRGLDQRGRARLGAFVRAGGGLLVAAGPDIDGAVVNETLRSIGGTVVRSRPAAVLRLSPDDPRHPVFRALGGADALAHVGFSRARLLEPAAGAAVVARFSDGSAALVEERAGRGRLMVFASDLNNQWNDLPVQPVFVPFVHELLRYLSAPTRRAMEYLVGDLAGVGGSRPGVATVASARVAVNVDPMEFDPASAPVDLFRSDRAGDNSASLHAGLTDGEIEEHQRLWQYAMFSVLLLLVSEGLVARGIG